VQAYPRPGYIFPVSSKSVQGFRSPGGVKIRPFPLLWPGLLISNIDIDVDIIDDTFDVGLSISISTILSYKSIDRGIYFVGLFYRHYIDTSQLTCK